MNMEALCPLPVDWLGWLEGDSNAASSQHLETCPACRALVEELRVRELDAAPLSSITPTVTEQWIEDRPSIAVPSEVWWTHPVSLDGSKRARALLLLLDSFMEGSASWFHAAPLSTDLEAARPSELLLDGSETELAVPLVVLVGHQSVISQEELDARIGNLRDEGRELVAASLEGTAPDIRYGPPLESENDPRLSHYDEERRLMRILGRRFEEKETQLRIVGSAAHEDSGAYQAEGRGSSTLRWRSDDSSLTLAAASSESMGELEATLIHGDKSMVGVFESRVTRGGILIFRVESSTIDYPVQLEIISSGKRHASETFEPSPALEVRIAPASVFPKTIQSAELLIPDE